MLCVSITPEKALGFGEFGRLEYSKCHLFLQTYWEAAEGSAGRNFVFMFLDIGPSIPHYAA